MLTRHRYLFILFFFLVVFMFTPRIPIYTYSDLSSSLRLDLLAMIGYTLLLIPYIFFYHRKNFLLKVYFIFLATVLFTKLGVAVYFATLLQYISIPFTLILCKDLLAYGSYRRSNNVKIFLTTFVWINVGLHIFSTLTGFSLSIDNEIGTEYILGLFGILHAPYNFSFVVSAFTVYFVVKNRSILNIKFLILMYTLVIGWSRISFLIVLITITYLFLIQKEILKKKNLFLIIIFGLAIPFVSSEGVKTIESLINGLSTFTVDPSLLMRINNVNNYFNWVSLKSFIIGGGSRSFLEFTDAYGKPGPIDIAYFRILAEIGFIGIILFYSLTIRTIATIKNSTISRLLLGFILVFSLFNESIVSVKVGQFFMILIALVQAEEIKNPEKICQV